MWFSFSPLFFRLILAPFLLVDEFRKVMMRLKKIDTIRPGYNLIEQKKVSNLSGEQA